MAAADGLNDYQFKIGYTQKKSKGLPVTAGVHIEAIHVPTDELAGELHWRRMNRQRFPGEKHWAAPSVYVPLDHEQQGLATEMVRRLSAHMPNSTFHWHNFSSEGGLAVARKAVSENSRQHILEEDFVREDDWG